MPLTSDVILFAVGALLRHRGRVDEILSQSEATKGLPFQLPPVAVSRSEFINEMVVFFRTDTGEAVLELQNLTAEFQTVEADFETRNFNTVALNLCLNLYFEAADVDPSKLSPTSEEQLRKFASTGPSQDLKLAYYVVESHRLSRNSKMTRIALATADTLLETLSGNAGLFIKDEVTAKIVNSAIDAFAVKHDFDDHASELIFKRLLGAVAVAAAKEGDALSDDTGVRALFAATKEAHEQLASDDVAALISGDGLQTTIKSMLTTVASDPAFLTSDAALQASITTVLTKAATVLPDVLGGKQDAVLSLVEALVSESAKHASVILKLGSGNETLAEMVLGAMLGEVQQAAGQNALFANLTSGVMLGKLYKSALSAIAANPEAVRRQIDVNAFVATQISGYAAELAELDATVFDDAATADAFVNRVVSMTLASLSEHPTLTKHSDKFGPVMAAAMLTAAADLSKDGLQDDDLASFIDDVIAASAENVALLDASAEFKSVVTIWVQTLSQAGVKALTSPKSRLEILRTGVMSMVQNPLVWKKLNLGDDAERLIGEITGALISDQASTILSGPALQEVIEQVLTITTDHIGEALLIPPDKLKDALVEAVSAINETGPMDCSLQNVAGYIGNFLEQVFATPDILDDPTKILTALQTALELQLNGKAL